MRVLTKMKDLKSHHTAEILNHMLLQDSHTTCVSNARNLILVVLRVERIINSKTLKNSNQKNLCELHVLQMQLEEGSKTARNMEEIILNLNVNSAVK